MPALIVDYSAHASFDYCPASWYEIYCNHRRRKWPRAQRDDARALGTLVHAGMEVWQQTHTVEVPQAALEEVSPTRECLDLAVELVWGYTQAYPKERWPLVRCEEPLQFPLLYQKGLKTPDVELTGLAKVDTYFYNPEVTEVDSGFRQTYTLAPGWWVHEYKTKSPDVPIGLYMQGWEVGLQASYQLLALRHHLLDENNHAYPYSEGGPFLAGPEQVQGVLVNVIEKPRRHIPQRTCKSCKEAYEFRTWLPCGDGTYACPVCGNRQVLQKLKENLPVVPPQYYRIPVTRSREELEFDRAHIIQVGQQMIQMKAGGLDSQPWRKGNCVSLQYKRACDYYGPHRHHTSTLDDDGYETPSKDYRGLVQIEGGV